MPHLSAYPGVVWVAVALLLTGACSQNRAPVAMPVPPSQVAQAAPAPTAPAQPASAPAGTGPASSAPAVARPLAPAPLLGHVTREALREYEPWAAVWERPYSPDPAAVATIKAHAKGVTVLAIVATWCPDSKRELPRYFATMDAAGIGDAGLTMVGVDRSKTDAEGLTENYAITRVPTFVFLRDGKEIGRFVERTPAGSRFEAEVAKLLKQ